MSQPQELSRLLALASADSLPVDSGGVAGRRLGVVSAVAAATHLTYTVLYQTLWIESANAIGLITGLLGLAVSTTVAVYLLIKVRTTSRVAVVGVVYEIVLSLCLGLSETGAAPYSTPSAQVSWGAVVIVLFPFLIPARPAVVLSASVGAAAMTPLAMALVFGVTNRPWPSFEVTASHVLPPFLCAMLAWAPTRVLSQLSSAVQKARRLGSYELTARLGVGGMGEVWVASHRLLARPAAVKLIKPEMLGARDDQSNEGLIRRFEREAQVTANLESPHTVELYDFGVSADGVLFYVMELLNGVDLQTLVDRFGPLPPERAVHLLLQACDSLDDAHARGLIHRDVKPANLFICRKGGALDFLKVLDFGLVKRWSRPDQQAVADSLQPAVASVEQTLLGQILGTPAFLAPEAAVGTDAVDHRADLYALGCVAYFMLTGRHVFEETSVLAMAIAHVTKPPEPPSKRAGLAVPDELEAVIMACLEKDPAQRPTSAAALRARLSEMALHDAWSRERAQAWWSEHLPSSLSGGQSAWGGVSKRLEHPPLDS